MCSRRRLSGVGRGNTCSAVRLRTCVNEGVQARKGRQITFASAVEKAPFATAAVLHQRGSSKRVPLNGSPQIYASTGL